ncbi:glycosyltransferase [Clostridiisalibacter paucivorans]|uniref:glycosyltransferase n=1 Tax=Clostridiisalibacter paucivorans TaxID=408753 RepID=UPI00047B20B4|nr:glycosyltransferase [Clostridiisalibacter paucivorans]
MNIVLLIPKISYGGASKIIIWLANQLSDTGYKVSIIEFYTGESHQKINEEIEVIRLDINQSKNRVLRLLFGTIIAEYRLHRVIRKVRPDLVITFGDPIGSLYILINKINSKRKIIVSERSDPYSVNGLNHKIRRAFFNLADGIVFQTEEAMKYFSNNIQSKGVIIANPININKVKRAPYSRRKNKIVFVGRFDVVQKRQDIMVEAFFEIKKYHKDLSLVFYGDGKDESLIRELVNTKGLEESVIFAGRVENVLEKIWDAKVFVLTSDYEGIPNALIEAMALGIPVVSTDCSPGGARLLIDNNKNGILVPTGDPKGISRAIRYILENPNEAERYGTLAQEIVTEYSSEEIMGRWISFIEKL